jgi:hypothetical protein
MKKFPYTKLIFFSQDVQAISLKNLKKIFSQYQQSGSTPIP